MKLLKLVPDDTNIDFLRWRVFAFALSIVLMAASVGLVATKGLNFGVDFIGGFTAYVYKGFSNADRALFDSIPEALAQKELAHKSLTELHVTASMHARKTLMAELSDGFIALPGGIGTLEEIFEIWTWAQLGFHAKPCGLLNVAGYYDGLIAFLDHAVAEQFVKPLHRSILSVEQEPVALLDGFARYQAPSLHKWVDRDQT